MNWGPVSFFESLTATDQEIVMHLANSDIDELQNLRQEFLSVQLQSTKKAHESVKTSTQAPVAQVMVTVIIPKMKYFST